MTDNQSQTRRTFLATSAAIAAAATGLAGVSGSTASAAAGKPAPEWDLSGWLNGDGGSIAGNKGKVIVIDFFQLWCPGCNKFSGPLMKHWQQVFADDIKSGHLQMVKIHTVFEGHKYQNNDRLKAYIKEKQIALPVGLDRHKEGSHLPETMLRYNTRGTPETAVIDKNGVIRFQEFGFFEYEKVQTMIRELLNEARA